MYKFIQLSFLLSIYLAAPKLHADERADEVDYIELAARLLADGHYDRAEIALHSVNPQDKKVDRVRFHSISGLVALRTERFPEAADQFSLALEAHASLPTAKTPAQAGERAESAGRINLYLGQTYMRMARWHEAIAALDASGDVGNALATVHELRAQAWWELKDYQAALNALDRGTAAFQGDSRFLRRKIFYLISIGFYQHAAELGQAYLSFAEAKPADFVAIGSALRKSGQMQQALMILERARLLYPQDRSINIELAHTYLGQEKAGVAADIFSETAIYHPDLLVEAAELQRQAGRLSRALLLNSGVSDQAQKLRQRLSLYVAMERWEAAATMGNALQRNSLLDDDSVRYAYAYSLYKIGDYEQSDRVLGGIAKGEIFRKAAALRKAMEVCRADPWRCR
jgi:predicted Zn-dependent protease